jgi:hypothetical protein
VAWITISTGRRGSKFGDGTQCAIGLCGGECAQADPRTAATSSRQIRQDMARLHLLQAAIANRDPRQNACGPVARAAWTCAITSFR